MALRDILSLIAAKGGVDMRNEDQRIYTARLVNAAWKELYTQNDMIGSGREQIYQINPKQGNLISLESYVGQVRAVRYFYPSLNLKLRSTAPRYVARFWQSQNFLSWELKGDRPLYHDIKNAGPIVFTFQQPLTKELKVTVIGATYNAQNLIETVCIPCGQTTVTTQNSFEYDGVMSIAKSDFCNSDCVCTDIDGRQIATIANCQKISSYQIIQVINLPNNQYGTSNTFVPATQFVECLWKLRWKPVVKDEDELICPLYEEAVFWKYMENIALLDSSQSIFNANQAQKFKDKCDKLCKDISQDASQTQEMSLNFGENPTLEAFAYITQNQTGYGYPGAFPQSPYPLSWP